MHSSRTKAVFKQICELYDLVYFGSVSQHTDEHEMVRGFTLSPSHVDRHYCVGSIASRDVILLERTDTVSFPDKPSKSYTWIIMQFDLRSSIPQHIVFNSYQYEPPVYATLFTKLQHLHKLEPGVLPFDPLFGQKFVTYTNLQHSDNLSNIITGDTARTMAYHFANLDYELYDDQLLVYMPTVHPKTKDIEHMTKAGIWLSDELDKRTSSYEL